MAQAWGIVVAACLALGGEAAAQATVKGRVTSGGAPVPFASIGVRGTTLGTVANEAGAYRLERLKPGRYTLTASAVGFGVVEQAVTLADGETTLDFDLPEAAVQGEGVTVTGTMQETFVSESPVKVEVISMRYLEKIPTSNVMEVIGSVNGLYQQIDCGVCYTNNIRINGMEGPYTAVLIDGMPVMSALGTVYGLNGISPAIIQQIEVIKGPVSTLYGSEAMAGVINVITKRPEHAPRLAVHAFGTSDREASLDVAAAPRTGRLATLVSGNAFYLDHFLDGNGDGFTDVPLTKRVSLFGKGALTGRDGFRLLDLSAKAYYEDRFGGVEAWRPAHRGSAEVYGESIYTKRVELLGAYRPVVAGQELRLEWAFNRHHQDSYYGATRYDARQQVAFANLVWRRGLGRAGDLLVGLAGRHQTYDDNTAATAVPERRFIPGAFVQHEAVVAPPLRLLTGLRLDHHRAHGLIASPRLSVKLQPLPRTTARLNAGTGFRVVNLFTEDHAALTGARRVVLLGDLAPERSYSATTSLQQVLPFGGNPLTLDLDAFYTYFTNQIVPDYDTDPDLIVYRNLTGHAVTRGLSLSAAQAFTDRPLSYNVGITVMDVFTRGAGGKQPITFAPTYRGVASVSYTFDGPGVTLDYTASLTGPMRLPAYAPPFARPTRSQPFLLHNLQLTKDVALAGTAEVQLYLSVENATDFVQESPLVDPANPFGEHFDTSYVYGPLHGRCLGAGLRLTVR